MLFRHALVPFIFRFRVRRLTNWISLQSSTSLGIINTPLRTHIARVLAAEPSIILADEPTGNLDSSSGAEIMGIIKGLHQAGNTIVLITHDSSVAGQAQRKVYVHDGILTERLTIRCQLLK